MGTNEKEIREVSTKYFYKLYNPQTITDEELLAENEVGSGAVEGERIITT